VRNAMADQLDERMILHRLDPASHRADRGENGQIRRRRTDTDTGLGNGDHGSDPNRAFHHGATDQFLPKLIGRPFGGNEVRFLKPGARLADSVQPDFKHQAREPVFRKKGDAKTIIRSSVRDVHITRDTLANRNCSAMNGSMVDWRR